MGRARRSRRPVLVALLSLAGLTVGWGGTAPRPRPGRDTFAQVERGMTLGQASAAVGGPPGDYRTDRAAALPHGFWRLWRHTGWVSNDAVLFAEFDERGVAIDVRVMEMEYDTGPGLWERARDRLGVFQPPPQPRRPPGVLPPELD